VRRTELDAGTDYAWAGTSRFTDPVRVRLVEPIEPGWTARPVDPDNRDSEREWVKYEPSRYRSSRSTRVRAWEVTTDGELGRKVAIEPRDITCTWAVFEQRKAERDRENEASARAYAQLIGEQTARFDALAALGIDVRSYNWRGDDTTVGAPEYGPDTAGPYLRGRHVNLTFDQLDRLLALAGATFDPAELDRAREDVLRSRPAPEITHTDAAGADTTELV
jgi:hypothetical protein